MVDVIFMLVMICAFNLGDAVWESQVPAVLQALFDEASADGAPMQRMGHKQWFTGDSPAGAHGRGTVLARLCRERA